MKRLAIALLVLATLGTTGAQVQATSAAAPMTPSQVIACYSTHRTAAPMTTLGEARQCAPTATVYTTMPAITDGMTAIIHIGKFYSVVTGTASTTPVTASLTAFGTATLTSSYCGRYWRNFSKQNWWFGNAAGGYQPYGYQMFEYPYGPFGCSWYADMTANNFYFSWCVCAAWGDNQGTYDSNWAWNHGYGWWAAAWTNGFFVTPIPVEYGFTCRGELYPSGSLYYPGCVMG